MKLYKQNVRVRTLTGVEVASSLDIIRLRLYLCSLSLIKMQLVVAHGVMAIKVIGMALLDGIVT